MTQKEQRVVNQINNRLSNRLLNMTDAARRILNERPVSDKLRSHFPDAWAKVEQLCAELPKAVQFLRAEIK